MSGIDVLDYSHWQNFTIVNFNNNQNFGNVPRAYTATRSNWLATLASHSAVDRQASSSSGNAEDPAAAAR